MRTLHNGFKWYKSRKKPHLQIKILEEILNHGELSKIKFEHLYEKIHYHPDIISAFDNLKQNKLIVVSNKHSGRGRTEISYTLTENGLIALISENPTPYYFWKTMILWYCSSKSRDNNIINNIYSQFTKIVFGHLSSDGRYSFQLKLFDKLLIKWINHNKLFVDSIIPPSQVVIECLATNRELTFESLLNKTHLSKSSLSKILALHTVKSENSHTYRIDESKRYDIETRIEEYISFIMHGLITVKKRNDDVFYELSLFGIMSVMAIIRYSQMGKVDLSRYFGLEGLDSIRLFNSLCIEEYYEKIARAHGEKLPLIFGVWTSLNNILGRHLVYCFDPIIDKKARLQAVNLPLALGGMRELYDDAEVLALLKRSQLQDIYQEGCKLLSEFHDKQDKDNWNLIHPVYQKLLELDILLRYVNVGPFFLEYINVSLFADSLDDVRYPDESELESLYNNQLGFSTSSLREEIQFLFYLNLSKTQYEFLMPPFSMQFSNEFRDYRNREIFLKYFPSGFSPREKLIQILREHPIIKEKFDMWIKEIRDYHFNNAECVDKFLKLEIN